jgi:hypothetical protein
MATEDMQRTLTAEFPMLSATFDGGTELWSLVGTNDWIALANGAWFNETSIDLSGYALERKTFFPYTSIEQRSGSTQAGFQATLTEQPTVSESTIISSVPFTQIDLALTLVTAPGFIQIGTVGNLRFNRDVIMHGETKNYVVDTSLSVAGTSNILKLASREVYSSLEPTAADKLYCYRVIYISSARGEGISGFIPASRVILPGTITEEPQLEHMMRLKRSYELANQV